MGIFAPRQLFRHLKHQNLYTSNDLIYSSWLILLVPFLAIREAVVLLANDSIMSGTSIQLFRHLEHQNPSSNGWDKFLVPFLATREAVAPLAKDLIMLGTSIRSFTHLKHQNMSTSYDFIHRSRIIFFRSVFCHYRGSGITCKWSYHVGEINTVV